jgi:hypothetical protein
MEIVLKEINFIIKTKLTIFYKVLRVVPDTSNLIIFPKIQVEHKPIHLWSQILKFHRLIRLLMNILQETNRIFLKIVLKIIKI